MLRPDPTALRVAQTSDERGISPGRTPGTLYHMAWLTVTAASEKVSYKDNYTLATQAVYARQLDRAA